MYRLNAEPNFYGCHDPQCLDSTWDHECPVTPTTGRVEPTKWRVDSVDNVIQVRLPDPGETLTVHNDGEHFWITNERVSSP